MNYNKLTKLLILSMLSILLAACSSNNNSKGTKGSIMHQKISIITLGVNDLGGFPGSGFVVSDPNFEITEVTDEGIQIVTNGLVERNPNGNINLVKASHGIKHHLTFGQTIELVTQTMDSGFSVSITPLEIINE